MLLVLLHGAFLRDTAQQNQSLRGYRAGFEAHTVFGARPFEREFVPDRAFLRGWCTKETSAKKALPDLKLLPIMRVLIDKLPGFGSRLFGTLFPKLAGFVSDDKEHHG